MAERKLAWLPDRDAPIADWRHWLTAAFELPAPWRVEKFLRHGRHRTDTCELVLAGPDGRQIIELGEQRNLEGRAMKRTLDGMTDGLIHLPRLSDGELDDIWYALVRFATVTANATEKSETEDWLEQTVEKCERVTGYSMTPARRPDALAAIYTRNRFDYLAARRFTDPASIMPPRPILLVDAETGDQWMRVGELATFWRHVLGVDAMSQRKIDNRLSAIGVRRHEFTVRPRQSRQNGTTPRTVRLYRVAGDEAAS
jgi:hypothetical protein